MVYKNQYGDNYIFMSAFDGTMLVQPFEPIKELSNQLDLKDRSLSQSLANYTYSKKTDQAYELCADFATNTIEAGNMTKAMRAPDSYEYYGDFTKHPKGRHCYNLAVYSPLLPEVPASDLPVNGSGMEPATAD